MQSGKTVEVNLKVLFMKLQIIPLFMLLYTSLQYSAPKGYHLNHQPINQKAMLQDTLKKSTVSLEQKVLKPMTVLFISDTSDMTHISNVMQSGYGELFGFINKNGLTPGKVMGFYLSYANPVSLETAVEVDKVPATLTGRIQSKIVEGGDAIVAHYTGPYEKMEAPYNAIAQWIKDNHKQAKGAPFEVYLNSPSTVKDNSELKTDVCQLLQ